MTFPSIRCNANITHCLKMDGGSLAHGPGVVLRVYLRQALAQWISAGLDFSLLARSLVYAIPVDGGCC